MCYVGWPEAKCRPSVAMLARVTRVLAVCAGGCTYCNDIKLVDRR